MTPDPKQQARERLQLWRAARATEYDYARKLRMVAKNVDDFVVAHVHGVLREAQLREGVDQIYATLLKYADVLDTWATSAARAMVTEVAARNRNTWMREARDAGLELRNQIEFAPIESTMRELMKTQVGLIKSLPLEAAQRVQDLAIEHLSSGERVDSIVAEIMRTGEVTRSRAETIARTECGRASTSLTQARSEATGNTHYTWRSMQDSSVRDLHRHLDGTVHAWSNPPVADERTGIRAHPGCIWNCRCIAIPIITNF